MSAQETVVGLENAWVRELAEQVWDKGPVVIPGVTRVEELPPEHAKPTDAYERAHPGIEGCQVLVRERGCYC